jgi:hypothetical protein
MNYECEADYNAAMSAQAESEAQYNMEQERQYIEYLDALIENKQYQVFGIEICLDLLNSMEYEKSGLTPQEFLSYKKDQLLHPKEPVTNVIPTPDF